MPSRRFSEPILSALITTVIVGSLSTSGTAKQEWRHLKVDNIEIVSDLGERDLKEIHRQVFYFSRTMERVFGTKLTRTEDPVQAVIFRNESGMAELVGKDTAERPGVFYGSFGFEMFVGRKVRRNNFLTKLLFHELTHRNINPMNPPLWFHEGMAVMFEAVTIERNKIQVGLTHPDWVSYHANVPKFDAVDFEEFFNITTSSDHYTNNLKNDFYYATAWIFAHYCWFGDPRLKPGYVQLSEHQKMDEELLQDAVGMGYAELEEQLKEYARAGRYTFLTFDIEDLPELPKPVIAEAPEALWRNFHARILMLNRKFEEARRELAYSAEDDLMATETLAITFALEGTTANENPYFKRAYELGSQNPIILTAVARKRFQEHYSRSTENGPALAPQQAREIINILKPTLRLHSKNPSAVRLLIDVFDAAYAQVPPVLMQIFETWEIQSGEDYPEGVVTLTALRERQ